MALRGQPARWFLCAAVAGALLAACAGGVSSLPQRGGSSARYDALVPAGHTPPPSQITVSPSRLSLSVGAVGSVVVAQKGYTGVFTSSRGVCQGVATWTPSKGKGPSLSVRVTGVAPGSCEIGFFDAQMHAARLLVTVTASHSRITVTPSQLSIPAGASSSAVVEEKAYTGTFTSSNAASSCKGIASWAPSKGQGPSLTVRVKGQALGHCEIDFFDAQRHEAVLQVDVTKTPPPSRITVTPSQLSVPADASGSVLVAEKGYSGAFTSSSVASPCSGLATWAPSKGKGPSLSVRVTGVARGSCEIDFFDARMNEARLRITITLSRPSPSPSPSPTPTPSPVPVFVADTGNNAVKEIPPGCVTFNCVTTIDTGFTNPRSVALDATGDIFVAENINSNAVQEIPRGCIAASCVITLGGGFAFPTGVAFDLWLGSNVVVADSGNNAVKAIPPGCVTAGCVITLGGGFNYPSAVAVDASGDIFVTDYGNNAVKEIPPGCITAGCVVLLGGGFTYPNGVAVDGSGNVFVGGYHNDNAVDEIPRGCISASCVTTIGGGFSYPVGLAVDASDNVFVADEGSSLVKEIPHDCVVAFCVTAIGGGFSTPTGVAVPLVTTAGRPRRR